MSMERINGLLVVRHTETDGMLSVYRGAAHLGLIFPNFEGHRFWVSPDTDHPGEAGFDTEEEALNHLRSPAPKGSQ